MTGESFEGNQRSSTKFDGTGPDGLEQPKGELSDAVFEMLVVALEPKPEDRYADPNEMLEPPSGDASGPTLAGASVTGPQLATAMPFQSRTRTRA